MSTRGVVPEPGTVALIHAEAAGAIDRQFEQNAALTARAQQVLGYAGLILGVFVALRPPDVSQTDVAILLAIGVALFALIAITGGLAWSLRGLRRDPAPGPLWERYRLAPQDWLRQLLVLNLIESHAANRRVLETKVRYLRASQVLLAVEVLYLAMVLIILPHIS